jgi:hypothetical protein
MSCFQSLMEISPCGGLSYRGQTKVVVMDISGKHLMDYHLGNNNKPLWRGTPTKVTSDNDNIYVIDKHYTKDRVVLLKWDGLFALVFTCKPYKQHASRINT